MYIDLDALPELVNANDEDLFRNVAETVCINRELDVRYVTGGMLDEYHDVPLYENYPHLPEVDDDSYDPGHVVLVPKQTMIDLANDEVGYYSTSDYANQLRNDWAVEGQLIATPYEERSKTIHTFLDMFVPNGYMVRPTDNIFIYTVHLEGKRIGAVHFLDSTVVLHPCLTEKGDELLLSMYRAAFNGR